MAEKKKFEKPQMEAIKLDTKVQILAGSCSSDSCTANCGLVCNPDTCSWDWG